MNPKLRILILCMAGLGGLLSVGCTTSADGGAMKPTGISASHRTGMPIQAAVSGGAALTPMQGPGITNEDFKTALESSLVQSGLFKGTGGGGYRLEAFIAQIDQPIMGFSMRVNMEVGYTLHRGNAVVWRKSIHSTYEAPVSEAFAGFVRLRKATEGAARENIAALLRELDGKRL